MSEVSTQQIVTSSGFVRTITTANDKSTSTAGKALDSLRKLPKIAQQTEAEKAITEIEYVLNGQNSNVMLYNSIITPAKQSQNMRNY